MITGIFRAAAARVTTAEEPQIRPRELRAMLLAIALMLWAPALATIVLLMLPSTAQAAETIRLVLEVGTLAFAVVALGLSTFAGITALLLRLDRELSGAAKRTLPRWMVSIGAHMFGCWLAGVLTYMTGQQQRIQDPWLILISIILASFAGAVFVERMAERFMFRTVPPVPPSIDPTGGAA